MDERCRKEIVAEEKNNVDILIQCVNEVSILENTEVNADVPSSGEVEASPDEMEATPDRKHQELIDVASPTRSVGSALSEEMSECLCWGFGEFGQNGNQDGKDVEIGAVLPDFSTNGRYGRVKLMSCGSSHTVVVTDSNEVFAWGNGSSGQLGCGNKKSFATPQKVKLDAGHVITGLVCGSRHTVIVTQEGKCFSFGNNFYAQLGYNFRMKNYKENQVLPHLLLPLAHHVVKSVACGEKHTLFLFATGQLAVCGQNSYGQLGTADMEEILSPKINENIEDVHHIACGAGHSIAATGSGELYVWGNGRACGMRRQDVHLPMRKLTCHDNVIMVAGGSGHSMALTVYGVDDLVLLSSLMKSSCNMYTYINVLLFELISHRILAHRAETYCKLLHSMSTVQAEISNHFRPRMISLCFELSTARFRT
ncbi:ultraviolet-B receptor UVR8-like [Anneissia japonica]|uniref:ultraviolet-B receptor UVR8-like n=1 Tax=Anneissia japonica TaxID=1529436 RepID=UPI001425BA84|nr:ultraviolet-B receptor UVR8-like [Anneissia japonica]